MKVHNVDQKSLPTTISLIGCLAPTRVVHLGWVKDQVVSAVHLQPGSWDVPGAVGCVLKAVDGGGATVPRHRQVGPSLWTTQGEDAVRWVVHIEHGYVCSCGATTHTHADTHRGVHHMVAQAAVLVGAMAKFLT